jgi:hypothetical protein
VEKDGKSFAIADLFDGDSGLPRLFLVKDGKADCAGGVDVWVK